MVKVARCRAYDARVVGREQVCFRGSRSVFKVYFVSIVGRDDPTAYEWEHCALTEAAFLRALPDRGLAGVGFVTAFPHITKVFRFAPSAETLLHVSAFRTGDWEPIPLAREDGYVEYACLAEALIAADEYAAWAGAEDVETYLAYWSDCRGGCIRSAGKLRQYWQ